MNAVNILWAGVAVPAILAFPVTATTATFSDQATSTGNLFTAGTLFLSLDGECGDRESGGGGVGGPGADGNIGCQAAATFSGGPLKPGDPAIEHTFAVVNEGSLAGTLTATVSADVDEDHQGCDPDDYLEQAPASLGATALAAGASHALEVTVVLAADAPNACQGAAFDVTVVFDLVQ